jgi:RND superfamily putative drug exporter
MILVPATMELLGDANWWFPKWLAWLPKINIEGKDVPAGSVETIGEPDVDADVGLTAGSGTDREPERVRN